MRGARLKLGGKGPFRKASAARDWKQVFKLGPEVLKTNPWDVPTLRTMAEACAEHGHSQTELRYLKEMVALRDQFEREGDAGVLKVGMCDDADFDVAKFYNVPSWWKERDGYWESSVGLSGAALGK